MSALTRVLRRPRSYAASAHAAARGLPVWDPNAPADNPGDHPTRDRGHHHASPSRTRLQARRFSSPSSYYEYGCAVPVSAAGHRSPARFFRFRPAASGPCPPGGPPVRRTPSLPSLYPAASILTRREGAGSRKRPMAYAVCPDFPTALGAMNLDPAPAPRRPSRPPPGRPPSFSSPRLPVDPSFSLQLFLFFSRCPRLSVVLGSFLFRTLSSSFVRTRRRSPHLPVDRCSPLSAGGSRLAGSHLFKSSSAPGSDCPCP